MEKAPQPNPAVANLAILVGDWEMELSGASFLPSPQERVRGGRVHFEWIEGGALLAMRQGGNAGMPPAARWIMGRDEASDGYMVFYSDARGVSRVYAMSFAESEWRLWRDNSEFAQRFEATLSADQGTLTGHWEKSLDGGEWEHDFNVSYIRVVA